MYKATMFFILSLLLVESYSIFCSAYCKPNSCTGISKNQCTACDYPFILQTNTCVVDPASGYVLYAQQSSISSSHISTATCGPYSFFGQLNFNDNVRLDLSAPIPFPHYTAKIIAWTILYNQWDLVNDIFETSLSSSGQIVTQSVSTYSTAELLCSWSTSNEWYLKIQADFAHNTLNDVLRFVIQTTDVQIQPWGIKQYMILIGKCDIACQICLDSTSTNCTECAVGYKLSGTTCATTCLYKYGQTSNSTICVACDLYCITCNMTSTNCSSCQITGLYQSYLSINTCVIDCPVSTTEQTSTHLCIPCTNVNCLNCTTDQPSNCVQCQTPNSYWFNFDCLLACPYRYFANSPNCTLCDASCQICTGSPSPCSYCSLGYYLYNSVCSNICPAGLFAFDLTRQCLDCQIHCVKATISASLSLDNSKLECIVAFTRMIDFTTFPYQSFQTIIVSDPTLSLSRFNIQYSVLDDYSYKIQLTPKSTINMSATNFTFQINPKVTQYYSKDNYPFHDSIYTLSDSQLWTLVIYPKMQPQEQQFIDKLEQINSLINFGLGTQYAQEIKKSGLFMLLLPGAQLSSTIILHNSIPAQNLYEASRFWGSFIYFEVPKWEQGPILSKYLISQEVTNYIYQNSTNVRLLQSSSYTDQWRFHRTGFTNFFIFDTYLIVGILVLTWVSALLCFILRFRLSIHKRSILFNVFHKLHEVGLFYISISVALQWLTFSNKINDPTLNLNYIYASFGLSIFAVLYYMIYEVYVFYRLIPYAVTLGRSRNYSNFTEKYSYFLRDLRFEEYSSNKQHLQWTPRHLLRPYNYQVISCIRLVLIVVAPPIFHNFPIICISCMIFIQLMQILRFVFTWPFHSMWRNIFKLCLESVLLGIFILQMVTSTMISSFYQNLNTTEDSTIRFYYVLGWLGFVFVFLYNIGFIVYQIVDIVIGCIYTNRQRMQSPRKQYYFQKLDDVQDKLKQKLKNKSKKKVDDQQFIISNPQKRRQLLKLQKGTPFQSQTASSSKQRQNLKNSKGSVINFLQRLHGVSSNHDQNFLSQQMPEVELTPEQQRKLLCDIIQKGNLDNKEYENSNKFRLLIQQYQISSSDKQNKYVVKIYKVPGVFKRNSQNMLKQSNSNNEDNLLVPQKNRKQILLHDKLNFDYFRMIHNIFTIFGSVSTEKVTIRTFLIVQQNLYKPSQEIPQIKQNLRQEIQITEYNGSVFKQRLQDLLQGFPIPSELIQSL